MRLTLTKLVQRDERFELDLAKMCQHYPEIQQAIASSSDVWTATFNDRHIAALAGTLSGDTLTLNQFIVGEVNRGRNIASFMIDTIEKELVSTSEVNRLILAGMDRLAPKFQARLLARGYQLSEQENQLIKAL